MAKTLCLPGKKRCGTAPDHYARLELWEMGVCTQKFAGLANHFRGDFLSLDAVRGYAPFIHKLRQFAA